MTLIKSISGIRGTIGGKMGENLTPLDVVKFTTAFGIFIKEHDNTATKIVVGRDARLSGNIVEHLVVATLLSLGFDVINIGLATTPTTEIAVTNENADGGIIITASHNPKQWNALKLLNKNGEFLSAENAKSVLEIAENQTFRYSNIDDIGKEIHIPNYELKHIDKILNLRFIRLEEIKKSNFKVAIDCINSVGGIVIPTLLRCLGVENIVPLNCEPTGIFAHSPEP
jgi:phosphomannomutase